MSGILVCAAGSGAVAAVPKAQVVPSRILHGEGMAQGGRSGIALSLMDVRHSRSKTGRMERLVLDFGSADLREAKGLVGYYHAELQENPARLILELPQTYASRLPEKEILKRLRKSAAIRSAQIDMDRNLQSMTMIFEFNSPMQARVSRVADPSTTGKIVIDLLPDSPQARRRAAPATRANAATSRGAGPRGADRAAAPRASEPRRLASPATSAPKAAEVRRAPAKAEARRAMTPARDAAPSFIDSAPIRTKSASPAKSRRAPAGADGLTDADRAAAASVESPGASR